MNNAWKLTIMLLLASASSLVEAQSTRAPLTPTTEFMNSLTNNTDLLSGALNGDMRIRVLPTNNEKFRNFVKSGLLQVSEEAYLRLENGMASVYYNENKTGPMDFKSTCFVLVDPSNPNSQSGLYRELMEASNGNVSASTMFLVAHEVAHCMTFYERDVEMRKKKSFMWSMEEGEAAGIQPDAFNRVFGKTPKSIQYNSKFNLLYGDKAQRQYDERVADAFAAITVSKLTNSNIYTEAAKRVREREKPGNPHYTVPVFEQLDFYKEKIQSADHIYKMWHIAREIQRKVGVDPTLGPNSTDYMDPIGEAIYREREQNKNKDK